MSIGRSATRWTCYVKYLDENKLWDAKTRTEIETRIDRELSEDLAIAESAPFPPAELATQGVYCDGCHTIEAEWKRPKSEVMPPKSSVEPVWKMVKPAGWPAANHLWWRQRRQGWCKVTDRGHRRRRRFGKGAQKVKASGKKSAARKVRA